MFTVREATRALEVAAITSAVALVADICLPESNGFEVSERLRTADARTGIVLVTGYPSSGDRARALRVGAYYLVKPFRRAEFVNAVDSSTGRTLVAPA